MEKDALLLGGGNKIKVLAISSYHQYSDMGCRLLVFLL